MQSRQLVIAIGLMSLVLTGSTLDAGGMTSHFVWRDPRHILTQSIQAPHGEGFYLFEDTAAKAAFNS